MMLVSTTSIARSVAAPRNRRFDVFGRGNESTPESYRFRNFRRPRFAGSHAFADELRDRVLQFLVLMNGTDFHFAHQLVGDIKSRLHRAIFPESWFSVKSQNAAAFSKSEKEP